VDGKTSCSAVDGGLVMNNPTAAAVTHVLHNKRDFPSVNGVDDLLVLSLGNGPSTMSSSPGRKLRRNGDYSTSSVVDIVVDGVSDTVDQMLGNAFCWNRTDYVRIQVRILNFSRHHRDHRSKCLEYIKMWWMHAGERFDERRSGGVAERERCGNGAVWGKTDTNGE